MVIKVIAFVCFFGSTYSSFVYPITIPTAVITTPNIIHPIKTPESQYMFTYDVNDPNTKDVKSQTETKTAEQTFGRYSLLQPDGIRRTVDYKADDVNGFTAVVKNEAQDLKLNENADGTAEVVEQQLEVETSGNKKEESSQRDRLNAAVVSTSSQTIVPQISYLPRNVILTLHSPNYIWY